MSAIADRLASHQRWLAAPETGSRLVERGTALTGANLSRASLAGSDLTGATLTGATLTGADLSGADLSGADLSGADLFCADLIGADLTSADLTSADFTSAVLARAKLTGADLTCASLTDANLSGADLTGANLIGADLTRADLFDAICPDGRIWEAYRVDPLAGICQTPEVRDRALAAARAGGHTWGTCPMHAAHGWAGMAAVPEELRNNVAFFIAAYDARLLTGWSRS